MVTNFGDPICAMQAINTIILYFLTVLSNKEQKGWARTNRGHRHRGTGEEGYVGHITTLTNRTQVETGGNTAKGLTM